MIVRWSNAIPQAMQQHGGVPKPAASVFAPARPVDPALDGPEALDGRPEPFATAPAFAPKPSETA